MAFNLYPPETDSDITSPVSDKGEVKVEEITVAATNQLILDELIKHSDFWELHLD